MALFILQILYFMLPAYFANMLPLFVQRVYFLNYPVDFGKKFKGTRLLGGHKTIRGFFFGILAGIVLAYVQHVLHAYPFFAELSFIDYANWLSIGFLLGFGALVGDSVKSFFKRRRGVKPGGKFVPWGELDYSIGALLLVSLVYVPSLKVVLSILIINFIIHILANHLAYYFKLSKVKW